MKQPAIQFYIGDWMKDPAVRSVSLAARGLWIDLLCLMHESPQKGFLIKSNSSPWTPLEVSRMVGSGSKQVNNLLKELETAGVFSVDENGRIFCRRMVRDNRLMEIRREAGSKGGNPILLNQKDNQEDNQTPNQNATPPVNQIPTPSSSSSISSSSSDISFSPKGEGATVVDVKKPEIPKSALAAAWLSVWNTNRGPLPKIHNVADKRLVHALARLNSPTLQALGYRVPDDYAGLIQWLAWHDFYSGGGNRGWKADFDFLVASDGAVTKLHERRENETTDGGEQSPSDAATLELLRKVAQ